MAAGWSTQDTKMLVSHWGEADVQSQLDGLIRNKVIYEKISRKMEVAGFPRTWQQCRTKIKNLTHKYRKVGVITCCSSYNFGSSIILACERR